MDGGCGPGPRGTKSVKGSAPQSVFRSVPLGSVTSSRPVQVTEQRQLPASPPVTNAGSYSCCPGACNSQKAFENQRGRKKVSRLDRNASEIVASFLSALLFCTRACVCGERDRVHVPYLPGSHTCLLRRVLLDRIFIDSFFYWEN